MSIEPSHDPAITSLGQISRTVRDIAESEAWYRNVLGLTHLFTFEKLAFFDCGGTRLMLTQNEELNETESLLYFRVGDIDAAHRALIENGVEIVREPQPIHRHDDGAEEWMGFFNDPEGRLLALMAVRQSGSD